MTADARSRGRTGGPDRPSPGHRPGTARTGKAGAHPARAAAERAAGLGPAAQTRPAASPQPGPRSCPRGRKRLADHGQGARVEHIELDENGTFLARVHLSGFLASRVPGGSLMSPTMTDRTSFPGSYVMALPP